MKTLLWLAILAGTAGAQYEVKDFGGPWLPAQHAAFMPPGSFTHSENFFVEPGTGGLPGYRIQRRGLIKALSSSVGGQPILAMQSFWHEGDSLSIIFFCGGQWYHTSYAKVKYGKSNWYEGVGASNPSYISGYTLNTPRVIRPYSTGYMTIYEGTDSATANSENASLFFRFAAPGDSIYIDTDANGTYEQQVGKVRRVVTNRKILIDSSVNLAASWLGKGYQFQYQFQRHFSTTAIPDIEVYDQRAYVTNGVDPMQVIFWWDSTLWIREVHTAERVPLNAVQGWFNDTINSWTSPEDAGDFLGGSAKIDSFNLRFTRVYSWSKAWAWGEWSGGLEVGPTDMYFFRFGNNSGSVSSRQSSVRIVPIFYNDENSLILLNPLLGERDTIYRDIAIFRDYYPYVIENDSASYHQMLANNIVGHEGYILSMAGNMEVVIPRSVSGTIKSIANASVWVSEDVNVRDSVPAGTVGFNDAIYFIHSLNPEQNNNKTIVTTQTYTYKYYAGNRLPSPLPTGWYIVYAYTYGGTMGDAETKISPIPRSEWGQSMSSASEQDYFKVKIPNIDTTEIPISAREYYPVRFAVGSSAGDSVIFITANQPASSGSTGTVDTVTITNWELVKAEVPRFAGIESHPRIGMVGWGDTADAGIVSRSAITIRGPEPENWSPMHDVRVTDEQEPITAIESYNDFETIFTGSQIFGAALTGSGLWSYQELTKNIGCPAPRSVVVINDVLYFRGNDKFYRMKRRDLSGMSFEPISEQISSVLSRMDGSNYYGHSGTRLTENRSRVGLEYGLWDSRSERVWWFMAMEGSNYPNYALTYSPSTGVWDGVQTLGCASATALTLRDTTQMLLADPTRGMLAWANNGPADSGVRITTALEGTIYGPAGDTVRVRPDQMALTFSLDASQVAGPDSILWIMQNLGGSDFGTTQVTDTAALQIYTPGGYWPYATYTTSDRFQIDSSGSAIFWRWRLEQKANAVNTFWRFQPLRMSVSFTPNGIGD
jgi:hypothetical protein